MWLDEAHFKLSGDISMSQWRSNWTDKEYLYGVLPCILSFGIPGHYFFKGTVTGESYLQILDQNLILYIFCATYMPYEWLLCTELDVTLTCHSMKLGENLLFQDVCMQNILIIILWYNNFNITVTLPALYISVVVVYWHCVIFHSWQSYIMMLYMPFTI